MNSLFLLLPILLLVSIPGILSVDLTCQPGFTLINGQKCVKMFTDRKNHKDAAQACKTYGGSLVTIKNAVDNRAVYTMAASANAQYLYIGVYCIYLGTGNAFNMTCYHDDGSGPLVYDNFDTSRLPKYDNDGKFYKGGPIAMNIQVDPTTKWTLGWGDSYLAFMCETPVTVADPTCKYNYNGNCYLPSQQIPGVTASTTYSKAQSICRSNNANLVSIHSIFETDFIRSIYRNSGIPHVTIGAQASQPHTFNWVDGKTFDFDYHNPFDNFTGNCLQMDFSNNATAFGLWAEINCQVANSFLCKRKIGDTGVTKPTYSIPTINLTDPSYCNVPIMMVPGVITSFGYGTIPLPKMNCVWNLITFGSHRIGIYFTDVSTFLEIDIQGNHADFIAQVSEDGPFSVLSHDNMVAVSQSTQFDASEGKHGFRAVVLPY